MSLIGNIKPYWWGPNFWSSMYSFAAVYPERPEPKVMESAKLFFLGLKNLIPCETCRISYNNFISEHDTNINDARFFSSRNGLIEFIYNLRNKVNHKLELDYDISLFYFKKKLHYLVCENSNNDGIINDLKEVPFIPRNLESKAINFLKKKSQYNTNETKQILTTCRIFMNEPNFDPDDRYFKLFYKRTNSCREIIKKIYINMCNGDYCLIDSFNRDFELHLKLMYLGCTIIPESELSKFLSNQ